METVLVSRQIKELPVKSTWVGNTYDRLFRKVLASPKGSVFAVWSRKKNDNINAMLFSAAKQRDIAEKITIRQIDGKSYIVHQ